MMHAVGSSLRPRTVLSLGTSRVFAQPIRGLRATPKPKLEVLLEKELAGYGQPGDRVMVARGFFRNKLYPAKIAAYANTADARVAALGQKRASRAGVQTVSSASTEQLATRRFVEGFRSMLSRTSVSVKRRSNPLTNGPEVPVNRLDILRALGRDFFMLTEADLALPDSKSELDSYGEHSVLVTVRGSELLSESNRAPVPVTVKVVDAAAADEKKKPAANAAAATPTPAPAAASSAAGGASKAKPEVVAAPEPQVVVPVVDAAEQQKVERRKQKAAAEVQAMLEKEQKKGPSHDHKAADKKAEKKPTPAAAADKEKKQH